MNGVRRECAYRRAISSRYRWPGATPGLGSHPIKRALRAGGGLLIVGLEPSRIRREELMRYDGLLFTCCVGSERTLKDVTGNPDNLLRPGGGR
jgi:hypothetical protein